MDDPEAPEILGRKVGVRLGQQPDGIERWNCEGREKKQPGHVADGFLVKPAANSPENEDDPECQTDSKEHLKESAEVRIFKSLSAKPGPSPLNPPADSSVFAR